MMIFGLALGLSGQVLAVAAAQHADAGATSEESAGFTTLDSAQLAAMLQDKDFFLVNVHVPYEGEIEATDAFIAFDKIAENLDRLPADKDSKIVLYCRSGRMSAIAAAELSRLGYTRVSHLSGGMIGWKASGFDILETGGELPGKG